MRAGPEGAVTAQSPGAPVISVTRGGATPAEIAVIVAVLLAARATVTAAAETAAPAARRSAWARSRSLRAALPASWRASGLPR